MKRTNCNTTQQYIRYHDKLLSFIEMRVQNIDDAQDILQESFLQFEICCQKGHKCQYPKSYLFKIASNNIADYYKKKNKLLNESKCMTTFHDSSEENRPFPCDPFDCTFQFLSKLPPESQFAFIKSDIENIPQKQIAEGLKIPVSTLKSRIQKTRSILKKEFEQCLKKY